MEEQNKQVGIWIRVSTEDQARGESPEHHEKRASYYAQSKSWEVKEVYHLEAVSGKSVMQHPEAQRMLKDIKSGRIKGLIFSKLARLARNTRELLEFSELFREAGADLISLQESIDTSSPAGRLFYTILAAMAEWEREEIASRVAASVPIRAKLGKPLSGSAPFGYHWVEKKLVPHPEEGPIRKLMYELFLEHRRIRTVARALNQMGHRTGEGKPWQAITVKRLLLDPTAKGVRRANYTTKLKGQKVRKPKEDWIYTSVEPVVSEAIWDEVNGILDERQKTYKPAAKKAVTLFAGVIFCHCGNKMYVPSNTPKYVCQKCRNKIAIEDMDGVFHEQLKSFFFSPDELGKYLEGADQTLVERKQRLEALKKEQARVRKDMEKIKRLYLDDCISKEGFAHEYKPLEVRANQLDEQVPDLQGELDVLTINLKSSDEMISEARDLYSRWPQLAFEEKRRIVESITQKITVGDGEITIDLYYLPTAASRQVDSSEESSSSSSKTMAKGSRSHYLLFPFCHIMLKARKPPNKRKKRVWPTSAVTHS